MDLAAFVGAGLVQLGLGSAWVLGGSVGSALEELELVLALGERPGRSSSGCRSGCYITNYYVFDAEDAFTNILTTYQNNRLIHAKFQFCQWEYPLAGVGAGNLYDYYQLQTRAAPRIINY